MMVIMVLARNLSSNLMFGRRNESGGLFRGAVRRDATVRAAHRRWRRTDVVADWRRHKLHTDSAKSGWVLPRSQILPYPPPARGVEWPEMRPRSPPAPAWDGACHGSFG